MSETTKIHCEACSGHVVNILTAPDRMPCPGVVCPEHEHHLASHCTKADHFSSSVTHVCAACDLAKDAEIERLKLSADVAMLTAHRVCHNQEHDPMNGKLAGYCIVCGVPWPCDYADPSRTQEKIARLTQAVEAAKEMANALDRCESNRGRFSCAPNHDCRCEKDRGISESCTCGADELELTVGRFRAAVGGGR